MTYPFTQPLGRTPRGVVKLTENKQYNGTPQYGYFTVVVNDGTGNPSSTVLNAVANAVDAVRPLGSSFGVHGPVVVAAAVAMTITTAAGYVHATVAAQVQAAIVAYINSLQLGQTLYFSRLTQIAFDASPGVASVVSVTLNGGTADLTASAQQVISTNSGSVVVS
ncbi:phage-related baseplate assembly protein [Silvimonas terrae]|uniref:Phage-related baseplate assembly protein n=1 Tax=Silvimonas terrae TaxID=300266 RepID=A0A840R8D8_9NEIS|nr:baseplate J/gp47 family protein [Silvimonas terrae]MBB5189609.1 phage-related baseplate assembly protein [Silvimonas terrae]